jgi:hypothetical protein
VHERPAQRRGALGNGLELVVGDVCPKLLESSVDPSEREAVESAGEAVPDPLERGDVAGQRGTAPCRRVDLSLPCPEVEPRSIYLSRGSIAQLEVQSGLGYIERRVAGSSSIS